jgi:hypothetical protein
MQRMGAAITEFCRGVLLKPVFLSRVGRLYRTFNKGGAARVPEDFPVIKVSLLTAVAGQISILLLRVCSPERIADGRQAEKGGGRGTSMAVQDRHVRSGLGVAKKTSSILGDEGARRDSGGGHCRSLRLLDRNPISIDRRDRRILHD